LPPHRLQGIAGSKEPFVHFVRFSRLQAVRRQPRRLPPSSSPLSSSPTPDPLDRPVFGRAFRPAAWLMGLSLSLAAGCGGGGGGSASAASANHTAPLGMPSSGASAGGASSEGAGDSNVPETPADPIIPADGVVRIEVATDAAGVIRDDIGRATFGSGIAFDTPQLRWTLDHLANPGQVPVSSNTRDAMRGLNLGSLRFPNGDSSFHFVSEDPGNSYPAQSSPNEWDRYLTADEVVRYTAPSELDMERLFQVNTEFWLDRSTWRYRYLNDNVFSTPGAAPSLNLSHADTAARKAADWMGRDAGRTLYWEVGNEDWARWNGAQYAEIFSAFQKRMKAARPEARLLAQGLAADYKANTPDGWLQALTSRLQADGSLDSVYAYSLHQYLHTDPYAGAPLLERRGKQTEDMLATVAEGRQVAEVQRLLGTGSATSPTGRWKLWMTEFNIQQPNGQLDTDGKPRFEAGQDMGHGLVIADWTGKLLEQNVERVFMHSLDHHPRFALVQYANLGSDIEHPMVSVPGHAFSLYAQAFGKTMLRNRIAGNPVLTAPGGKSYPQVSAYASLAADGASLRVVVINRHLRDSAQVSLGIQATASRRVLADGGFSFQQLRADALTDTNAPAAKVAWSSVGQPLQRTTTGTEAVTVAPASVNLFILPLRAAGT
jgi:hypothetical protein